MKKSKKTKPELQSWYKDRYQRVIIHNKLLALVLLALMGCTLMLLFIISQLIPLKTIEPYVVQIDSRTGLTQVVNPLTATELTANEAVNNYFIVQYIRAREGYSASNLLHNVNLVRLMSEPLRVYNRYMAAAGPNNPSSPIARLGVTGTRTVRFKSFTYLSPQVVQLRVLITETSDKMTQELHRVILLSFEYTQMGLSAEERYINPLGFRITDYQINEDVLQQ